MYVSAPKSSFSTDAVPCRHRVDSHFLQIVMEWGYQSGICIMKRNCVCSICSVKPRDSIMGGWVSWVVNLDQNRTVLAQFFMQRQERKSRRIVYLLLTCQIPHGMYLRYIVRSYWWGCGPALPPVVNASPAVFQDTLFAVISSFRAGYLHSWFTGSETQSGFRARVLAPHRPSFSGGDYPFSTSALMSSPGPCRVS